MNSKIEKRIIEITIIILRKPPSGFFTVSLPLNLNWIGFPIKSSFELDLEFYSFEYIIWIFRI